MEANVLLLKTINELNKYSFLFQLISEDIADRIKR